ncbi:hypothetical protein ACIRSU_26830 [Streptomyces sp. NPDC101160]|uniref:hypothetical protein n=1 Tax=Streptomyces sp. NPDC101160 TaxID=3366118 RepID=UPI00382FDE68
MSTEPQRPAPTSRITEALLPPEPAPADARLLPARRERVLAQPLPPEQPPRPAARPTETTTRLRPVPDAHPTETTTQLRAVRRPEQTRPSAPAPAPASGPAPAPASAPGSASAPAGGPGSASAPAGGPGPASAAAPALAPTPAPVYDAWALGAHDEAAAAPRPVRGTGRVVAAAVCAVLALGLVGGAVAGALLAGSGVGEGDEPVGYGATRALWHDAPVDTLFPRTLPGPSAGPGGATRTWTRIVVAPDAPCTPTTLPKALNTALTTVGCDRVLRATYTDATASHVTTVALVFTQADPATMRTLGSRADDELPPALAGPGTVADGFGAAQRASWWRHILPDLPVVVTAVSGFADGRAVGEPEPADKAMTPRRTTAVAQAGLGHEAKGVADAVERALRRTVVKTVEEDER